MPDFAQAQKTPSSRRASIKRQAQSTPAPARRGQQPLTAALILSLQPTHGNRLVSRLVQQSRGAQSIAKVSSPPHDVMSGIAQRMSDSDVNRLNLADKKKYEELKKKIETHNGTYPTHQIQWNVVLGQAKNVGDLRTVVGVAIRASAARAEQAKNAASSPQEPEQGMEYKRQAEDKPRRVPTASSSASPARYKNTTTAPTPTQTEEQAILSSLFSSPKTTAVQQPPTSPVRTNVTVDTLAIEGLRKDHPANASVTEFRESNETIDTISFEVTVEKKESGNNISVYWFVIHYHPDETIENSLHAKVSHDAAANVVLSKKNWLIKKPAFDASVKAWKLKHTK